MTTNKRGSKHWLARLLWFPDSMRGSYENHDISQWSEHRWTLLKQVGSKLQSYSAVKWCRYASVAKKAKRKFGQAVTFHDLVEFVRAEADLAKHPLCCPDPMRVERRGGSDKEEQLGNTNRMWLPTSSALAFQLIKLTSNSLHPHQLGLVQRTESLILSYVTTSKKKGSWRPTQDY